MTTAPPDNAPPFGFVVQRDMLLRACLDQRLTIASIRVLACMVAHANRQTAEAWPSIPTIATQAGCTTRSVMRAVQELEENRIVSKELRPNGRTRHNVYTLHPDAIVTVTQVSGCHAGHRDIPRHFTVTHASPEQVVKQQVLSSTKKDRRAQKKQSSNKRNQIAIELPAWLPADVWQEWKQHRGRKLTPVAEKNAFRKLDALRTQGHCPAKVIRRSLENGWAGLFADERGTETRADGATPAIKAVGVIQRDPRTEREIFEANRAEMARFGMELPPEDFAE